MGRLTSPGGRASQRRCPSWPTPSCSKHDERVSHGGTAWHPEEGHAATHAEAAADEADDAADETLEAPELAADEALEAAELAAEVAEAPAAAPAEVVPAAASSDVVEAPDPERLSASRSIL